VTAPEIPFGYSEDPPAKSEHKSLTQEEAHDDTVRRQAQMSTDENWTPVNFWYSLRQDQQQAFMAVADLQLFDAGERLMREGEHADHVAVITSGLTEVRVRENGAERVVAQRGPGQLIGERAALKVSRRSATVMAVVPVRALVVRTADFETFISAYPEVLDLIEKQIFTRMREYRPGLDPADLAGQNCTVIRTDVAGFSSPSRCAADRELIRAALREITRQAMGPLWPACWHEDRGDGHLIVVPASIPTTDVLDRLTTALPPRLRAHNRIHREPAQITLRVSVEVGPVKKDQSGVSGDAIIDASRLVDAPAFKTAIAGQGAHFGIIVSPFVHRAHVASRGDMDAYAKVRVRVKETRRSAWMQLTGTAQLGQVQLATSGRSSPCSRVYARASMRLSTISWRTWPAVAASPGTRSMTSMTRWNRSRSLSITMSNGVVVVPSSL
jgi:hypothetical protein